MSELIKNKILELTREYYTAKFGAVRFRPGKDVVKYAGRVFDETELVNLVDSSLDFWLTSGRFSEDFEFEFAEYLGLSDAIIVNSGSSANLLAVSALTSPLLGKRQLTAGDEVITAAAGFPTTVAPIVQNNLVPVFIDMKTGDYNIDPMELKKAVGPKTRAIFLAHTLGNPWNVDEVMKIAKENKLWVIEDNCDALGSLYRGKLTGTLGDISTFSFYPAHHITMGEGGCVATDDELLAKIIRSFRDWGRDCYCGPGENNTCGVRFTKQYGNLPMGYDHKYVYSHIGYNLKATDMQAAVGVAQLQKLPDFIEKRKNNFGLLYQGLEEFGERLILPKTTPHSDPSWFAFPLSVKENSGFQRNDLIESLNRSLIETRNLFAGNMIRQPAFMDIKCRVIGSLSVTDFIMKNTFFVGVYPGLDRIQIDYIISRFREFFRDL